MFHIIPLPNKNNKIISTKPYLLMNSNNIQTREEKCPFIEGTYYCRITNYLEATNNSQCIGNLLNNKPAHCELHEKETIFEIFQPEPNYIILINVPEIKITTTCGPDKQKIKGSALIHFNSCEIKINDITYSSSPYTHWDEIHIYPMTFADINVTISNNLQLKQLEKYQFAEKEYIDFLKPYVHQHELYKSTGILSIIIFIVAAYIIFKKRFYSIFTPSIPTNVPATETPRIFVWPSLNSKGGGVTSATPHNIV